ncbi:MAG: YegP family protein [Oscillospiraceae bacterium]|nr:YegP family protein [Oscillospiraceae bacterium]
MGKFVWKQTKAGFRFNLLATNGQVIATSETYSSEDACLNGIESVRNSCLGGIENQTVENFETLTHPKFEVYTDKAGEFRFRLKARNGQIVAVSEGYKKLESCLNGVDSVKRNAPEASVELEAPIKPNAPETPELQ